jgi:hypothetical protein
VTARLTRRDDDFATGGCTVSYELAPMTSKDWLTKM